MRAGLENCRANLDRMGVGRRADGRSTPRCGMSRWLSWTADRENLRPEADSGPTKPTKPSSAGFEGTSQAFSGKNLLFGGTAELPEKESQERLRGVCVRALNSAGCRQWLDVNGAHAIGIPARTDLPGVRQAIDTLWFGHARVYVLSDPRVP